MIQELYSVIQYHSTFDAALLRAGVIALRHVLVD
jgi:hypothetical protein